MESKAVEPKAVEPKSFELDVNHIRISGYEWAGEGDPVLLVHATGFHARCWNQVVARLPGRRIIALDLRCHGRSGNTEPPFEWQLFADDVIEFIQQLELTNITAVAHSMGGHLITLAAAAMPERFKQLLLIDPVILNPEVIKAAPKFEGEHPAAKRRNRWSSPQEMLDRFKDRYPFSGWDPQVLKDYCDYGLLPVAGSDEWELACPPHMEGAIYLSAGMDNVYRQIPQVTAPVRILRARERTPEDPPFDFGPSTTWGGLAEMFQDAEDVYLPDLSHFIPMEQPAYVAEEIAALVGR